MRAARRITISLPDDVVRTANEVAARQGRSRSEVIQEALEWHLRIQALPVEEPTREERQALAEGRQQHLSGEFASFDEIRRDLEADLLAQRSKKSAKTST